MQRRSESFFSRHIPGRLAQQSPKSVATANAAAQSRLNRRNQSKQVQAAKRQALISATRLFNGADGAPRIVAVVPLSADVNAKNVASALSESLDVSGDECPDSGLWRLR